MIPSPISPPFRPLIVCADLPFAPQTACLLGVSGGARTLDHLDHNQAPAVCRVLRANASQTEVSRCAAAERKPNRCGRVSGGTAQNVVGRRGVPQIDLGGER